MDIAATLVMTLGAVFLAWAWFTHSGLRWIEAGTLVLLFLVAHGCVAWGRTHLRTNPRVSAGYLEARAAVLAILGLGLTGAAVIVGIAGALATPQGTPELQKQLVVALVTAVGTSLTVLIKPLQAVSDAVGEYVKKQFAQAFTPCGYDGTSKAYRAAFMDDLEGATGWGFKARRARAQILAEAGCPGIRPVARQHAAHS